MSDRAQTDFSINLVLGSRAVQSTAHKEEAISQNDQNSAEVT